MKGAYNTMKQLFRRTVIFLTVLPPAVHAQGDLPYTTYTSFSQILAGRDAGYSTITRVSDPGESKVTANLKRLDEVFGRDNPVESGHPKESFWCT
jgi:hypothetical protein